MAGICGKIINGQLYNCDIAVVGGLEQEVVLINRADIDLINTVVDRTTGIANPCTHKVTHLQLKSGATGYLVTGLSDKKHIGATAKFNRNEDSRNDYEHGLNFKVYDLEETTMCFLKSLGAGADLVAVVKTKDLRTTSLGQTQYKIYGFDAGLKLTELNLTTLEGKGATPVVLASADDFEPHLPMLLIDTDLPTTETAFNNLFAQP